MNSYTNRVLCVEDHTASCDLIRFILQREGCDVVTAADFMEGLSKISQESFDLYLLDQCLPTGEGTDLCQKVHASDPHVPVIIYSADVRDATRQHALEAGAAKFLDKPIDPFVLSGVVKDQLEKSKLRSFDAKMEEIMTGLIELKESNKRIEECNQELKENDRKNAAKIANWSQLTNSERVNLLRERLMKLVNVFERFLTEDWKNEEISRGYR